MTSALRKFAVAGAVAALAGLAAGPASALPLLGIGASVSGSYWYVGSNAGSQNAIDLDADVDALVLHVGGDLVTGFGGPGNSYLARAEVRKGLDLVPGLLSGHIMVGGTANTLYYGPASNAFGPEAALEAHLNPLLLPVYGLGRLGATYLVSGLPSGAGALVPDYTIGAGFSFTPFSSIEARYRGFSPSTGGVGGLEVGLRLGI